MKKKFEGYLLVSDMDGTLLNSDKVVSEKNKEAIRYFTDNGGKFTLASGRMVQSVKRFIDELSIELPVILHNGAKIYDFKNNKVLFEKNIEEKRKQAIKRVKEDYPTIGVEIFCDEVVYIYQKCELTKRYNKYTYDIVYEVPEEVWSKPWTKVLLIGDGKELDKLEKIYKSEYDSGNCYRSGENYLDIVGNNINKGQSLSILIDYLKIDKNKVIAVGDNMNDIEMLELAKFGFFIEGGAERALKRAKLMAHNKDSNPIEYVVKWIEENEVYLK